MLKEQVRLRKYENMLLDALLTILSFWGAYYLRDITTPLLLKVIRPLSNYYLVVVTAIPIWLITLSYFKIYDYTRIRTFGFVLKNVTKSCVLGFFLLTVTIYLLDPVHYSRTLLLIFTTTVWIVLILSKWVALTHRRLAMNKAPHDGICRHILVVGTNDGIRHYTQLIDRHKDWGLNLVGCVDGFDSEKVKCLNVKTLGNISDIESIFKQYIVDEVLFAITLEKLPDIKGAIEKCEEVGMKVYIPVNFFDDLSSKSGIEQFAGIPMLTFTRIPQNSIELLAKRLIDVVIAATGLLLFLPIFILSTILIRTGSKGPVFFKQTRMGQNKRKFILYKFRTMYANAEKRLKEVEHLNEMSGPVFKIKNDPRITKIGRVLRKLSIDEMPQLWNVLKGDMSIVGPRPPIPQEVEKYERWQQRRLSMRPGITCLWQVSGRNNVDFDEWMKLDLKYIDNWSLYLDFLIMLRTLPVVLFGHGAS